MDMGRCRKGGKVERREIISYLLIKFNLYEYNEIFIFWIIYIVNNFIVGKLL